MLPHLLSLCAASTLLCPTALNDIFVDTSHANCSTGTGTITNPVCSIATAIGIAAPGDVILIAAGTYIENLVISSDLSLVGTGGATATAIDGNAAGSVIELTSGASLRIAGLTIQNGRAPEGGGIFSAGALVIEDSVITGNSATGAGGGGIDLSSGWIYIRNSTISSNTATGGEGGAIRFGPGVLTILVSEIKGNTASFYGGGICGNAGFLDAAGVTISDNHVTDGSGGGLEVKAGVSAHLQSSAFTGNSASHRGGGADSEDGHLDLVNSTISGNTAGGYGGGVSILGGGLTRLVHVTITDNYAHDYGGGIHRAPGVTSVRSSIIAGNRVSDPLGTDPDASGPFTSEGHNLIGTGGAGFSNGVNGDQVGTLIAPVDPLLGPLLDNGGANQTHTLLAGSPAIDAGDPITFTAIDQRGVLRPQGTAPDIGAIEISDTDGSVCNGDGGDQLGCTDCPCGNNATPGSIGGCLNSALTSARLMRTGSTSVSRPSGSMGDLRFSISGAPPLSFCILNSGDSVAPDNMANPCFGMNSGVQAAPFDGLRCATMNTRRIGGRMADSNGDVGVTTSPWGGEGGPQAGIANLGAGFVAGQTRFFQAINRDDPLLGCMRGLNTSQAIGIVFSP